MGLPWPFALRRTPAAAQAPGQAGSGCSRALFGQPLAALCGEDNTLPRPIQVSQPAHGVPSPPLSPQAVSPGSRYWGIGLSAHGSRFSAPSPFAGGQSPVWGRALATATAAAGQLLSQATVLHLLQELLAVLHQEGPTTEGIFRRAAGGTELRQLREALDRGTEVDVGSQPALLLAVILKVSASELQLEELLAGLQRSKAHLQPLALQEFLRSIPTKLLVIDLYEDWMAAMERASKQAKVEELKA